MAGAGAGGEDGGHSEAVCPRQLGDRGLVTERGSHYLAIDQRKMWKCFNVCQYSLVFCSSIVPYSTIFGNDVVTTFPFDTHKQQRGQREKHLFSASSSSCPHVCLSLMKLISCLKTFKTIFHIICHLTIMMFHETIINKCIYDNANLNFFQEP